MGIFDLYSKRQKRLMGETPQLFSYDLLLQSFRVQVIHIMNDIFHSDHIYSETVRVIFVDIHKILCREYGIFSLTSNQHDNEESKIKSFFLKANTEEALDVIELVFKYIKRLPDITNYGTTTLSDISSKCIEELNYRFKENGIGYCFTGDQIIRIDSTYIHDEVTQPVIQLLWNTTFKNAGEEYLLAHEHYKNGNNKECLNECAKAFESTLKIICHAKGWEYTVNDGTGKLIQICLDNGMVPAYLQKQVKGLTDVLVSGVPTIRNRVSGHGQGESKKEADDELTRYALNLTGANIIFLVEQSSIK